MIILHVEDIAINTIKRNYVGNNYKYVPGLLPAYIIRPNHQISPKSHLLSY